MKKSVCLFSFVLLFVSLQLSAQEGPVVQLLSDGEAVHIILRDTPPGTDGFKAYRRGPDDDAYLPMTRRVVKAVDDPYQAYELFKADAPWLERKFDTRDPVRLWRKMEINRSYARAYSLVSPGLRMALGRTLIDKSVTPGKTYRYLIELLDWRGNELDTFKDRITVGSPQSVEAPGTVTAEPEDDEIQVSWDYPAFRGRRRDLTVGFHVYRRAIDGSENAPVLRINSAPVLRVEDYLNYFDGDAEEGVSYRYGIQAVGIVGQVSDVVYSEPVMLTDTTPPLVPMGLTGVDQETGVLLLWNLAPEADVRYYSVYRSDSVEGEFSRINEKPVPFDEPQFIDTEGTRGKAWFYKVSATDAAGNESPPCGAITIIPKDTEPPAEVTGLSGTVNPEERSVELSWNSSGEADLKGYYVYRAEGGKDFMRITPSPYVPDKKPLFRDSSARKAGLLPGGEYRYAVSGVDNSGNEGERSEISLVVPDLVPPDKVFSFSARTTREGNVELRWQPSLSRDLQTHRLFRKEEEGQKKEEPLLIAELPAEETSFVDTEVQRGSVYTYYVVEVDAHQNAGEPSRQRRVVPVDITKPGIPRELSAALDTPQKTGRKPSKGSSNVRLSWTAPEDEDVTGYRVYRAAYPNAKVRQVNKSLVRETEYVLEYTSSSAVYTVRAVDSSGNEGPGASVTLEKVAEGGD